MQRWYFGEPFISRPYLNTDVVFSDEREQHIIKKHPGTLPEYLSQMTETVSNPDEIRQSDRDPKALLFLKWFDTIRTGRYLIAVVINEGSPELPWIVTSLHSPESYEERQANMADRSLIVSYDREGDILYVDKCEPYAEQESEEIGDEIVARLNPESNEVESLAILFFSKRLMASEKLTLPIDVDLRLVA